MRLPERRPPAGGDVDWSELDGVIARFERACWDGCRPEIADYLSAARSDVERHVLLRELAHIDLELRYHAGQPVSAGEYLVRYPELAQDPSFAADLIASEQALRRNRDGGKWAAPGPRSVDCDALTLRTSLPGATRAESIESTGLDGTLIAGRYRIVERLGEGGMGSVYLAEQIHPVRRQVALKVIRADLDSGQVLTRFEAERQALALMEHPHIARVLDAGTTPAGLAPDNGPTPAGRPFFVMELVRGEAITAYCDRHRLSLTERLALVIRVCAAVQHAHTKGVIHRDLKPSNILVEDREGGAVPKVIDFGLAKAAGGMPSNPLGTQTGVGTIAGTPLYMAPEQATSRPADVDARVDVYSLGVVLYELLTATTPLGPDVPGDTPLQELLRRIREQDPPAPSQRLGASGALHAIAAARRTEPGKLRRLVRGDLDWIVMKAMARDREQRYDTASSLARDLQRYLECDPVEAGPPGTAYRLKKFAGKHWAALAAAGAFGLLLTLTTAVSAGLAAWANRERVRAQAAEGVADEARRLAEQREREVSDALSAVQAQRRKAERREQAAIDATRRFGDAVAEESILKGSPELRELRQRLLKEPLALFQSFHQELQLDPGTSPESLGRLAQAAFDLGALSKEIGDKQAAKRSFEEARGVWERLAQDRPGDPATAGKLATCHEGIGLLQSALGQPTEALASHLLALAIRERLTQEHPGSPEHARILAGSHLNIGVLQAATGQPDAALGSYQRALVIRERLASDYPEVLAYQADLGVVHHNLGYLLSQLSQFDAAADSYAKALAVRERLARQAPDATRFQNELATTLMNLGSLHATRGRKGEALEWYARAVAIQNRLAEAHPSVVDYRRNLARTYNNIGVLQSDLKQTKAALASYGEARNLLERLVREHPGVPEYQALLAGTHSNLGNLYRAADQSDAALGAYLQSVSILEELVRVQPRLVQYADLLSKSYHNRGALQSSLGRTSEALEDYQRAQALCGRLAHEQPRTASFAARMGGTLESIALLHMSQRRLDEARTALLEAIEWQKKALALDPKNPTYQRYLKQHQARLAQATSPPTAP